MRRKSVAGQPDGLAKQLLPGPDAVGAVGLVQAEHLQGHRDRLASPERLLRVPLEHVLLCSGGRHLPGVKHGRRAVLVPAIASAHARKRDIVDNVRVRARASNRVQFTRSITERTAP